MAQDRGIRGGVLPKQTPLKVYMQPPKSSKTRTLLDEVVFAHNFNKLAGLPI